MHTLQLAAPPDNDRGASLHGYLARALCGAPERRSAGSDPRRSADLASLIGRLLVILHSSRPEPGRYLSVVTDDTCDCGF